MAAVLSFFEGPPRAVNWLNRLDGFGPNGDEQQAASKRAARETNHRFTVPLPTSSLDYLRVSALQLIPRGLTNFATDH